MTAQPEPGEPSLQDCPTILLEALKTAKNDAEKLAVSVSEQTLLEIEKSIVPIGSLLLDFQRCWIRSKESGADAVLSQRFDRRIDIKLLKTGKLDSEQFGKIVSRLNIADDMLHILDQISYHLSLYKERCIKQGFLRQVRHIDGFVEGVLKLVRVTVDHDVEALGNQINRCTLYNDVLMKGKTFKIASVSLLVSTLSFLVAISSIGISSGLPQALVLIVVAVALAFAFYLVAEWLPR